MRFNPRLGAVVALGLIASACAPVDPGYGEALRYDMAIQTIDPDPVYREGGEQPGGSGDRAQKASERYRKGAVKQPSAQSASGGGSSGGGSSSGSGPQ